MKDPSAKWRTKQKMSDQNKISVQNQNASRTKIQKVLTKNIFLFPFFRRDALKEQFGKEPSTVRCLAVKSALLGTRHPRKEKEAALQTVTGKPAPLHRSSISNFQPKIANIFSRLNNWISDFFNFFIEFCIFLRIFDENFPDFAPNSRKGWRLSLFQSILRKQIRKLPKILKSVKI